MTEQASGGQRPEEYERSVRPTDRVRPSGENTDYAQAIEAKRAELQQLRPDRHEVRLNAAAAASAICATIAHFEQRGGALRADLERLERLRGAVTLPDDSHHQAVDHEIQNAIDQLGTELADNSAFLAQAERDRETVIGNLTELSHQATEKFRRFADAPQAALEGFERIQDQFHADREYYRRLAERTRAGEAHREPA
jgi:hypothetical protein